MDVFQSVWYRLVLLFFAMYLTVLWLALGRSIPWHWCSMSPDGRNRVVGEAYTEILGQRAGLPSLEQSVRNNAAPTEPALPSCLLAALALFSKHPWSGARWMLLPGVMVHLYAVLLHRPIMLRLQPLLDRASS